jgi:predicted ATP-grasp superfamily ATP-dependent carboligase
LEEIGRRLGAKAILIPTTDEASIFVADHADLLSKRFLFHQQPPGLVRTLCSKMAMTELAKQCGVCTPEAVFPQSREEVLRFIETAVFPVMVKGIHGLKLCKRTGKRIFIARTDDELLRVYDHAQEPDEPNLMLQEFIPGNDDTVWMFNGYFDQSSDCLFGATGKKIRQCPVHRGVTSLGVCLDNEVVANTTKKFMKAIGYKGILDIGYRYDARDGSYKVLDVNPRVGATFRLFVSDTGMDVVRALYLNMTGLPVTCGQICLGRKWIVEDLDTVSCVRYAMEGNLSFDQWGASYRGIQEMAYFAWDDPLPILPMLLKDFKDGVGRIGKKLGTKLSDCWHSKRTVPFDLRPQSYLPNAGPVHRQ